MVVAVAASRGGLLGAILAFVLWSLPAFVVLVVAAAGADALNAEVRVHAPTYVFVLCETSYPNSHI